jgi:hypothetical protein
MTTATIEKLDNKVENIDHRVEYLEKINKLVTKDGNLRGIKWLIIVVLATLVSMGLPGAIMSYSQIAMKLFFSK